jgi:hypothetical protein
VYTYRQLGTNGALGNQLWEIAGTVGTALRAHEDYEFPMWDYTDYFYIPNRLFKHNVSDNAKDLSPAYLQELYHFEEYADLIHLYFKPSKMAEQIMAKSPIYEAEDTIAVHVRRANNLNLPDHHPVCPIEYFEGAVDLAGEGQLVVFSDDLEWCKKQELFKDAIFADGNPDDIDIYELTGAQPLSLQSVVIDLLLMTTCSKHIISNSSFSWWGAWLANSEEVYYPQRWYGPALRHINWEEMIPEDWTKVWYE